MVASNIAETKEKIMLSFIINGKWICIAFARALLNVQPSLLSPLQVVENIVGTIQFVAGDICPPQVVTQIIAGNPTIIKDIDSILTSPLQIPLVLCSFACF